MTCSLVRDPGSPAAFLPPSPSKPAWNKKGADVNRRFGRPSKARVPGLKQRVPGADKRAPQRKKARIETKAGLVGEGTLHGQPPPCGRQRWTHLFDGRPVLQDVDLLQHVYDIRA